MEIYIDVYILENIIIDLFLLLLSFIAFLYKIQLHGCYMLHELRRRKGSKRMNGNHEQRQGRQSLWEPICGQGQKRPAL